MANWSLHACPDLPVTELCLSDGNVVGLVAGFAISPAGAMLESAEKTRITVRAKDIPGKLEAYVADLAGRFVVLMQHGKIARVYPDPVCGHGPVYNPETRRLGASTALVLDRPIRDNAKVPAGHVADGTSFYRFGHTADAEVRRARSNHYIDLSDFSLHRHWPLPDTNLELGDASPRDLAEEIAIKLASNLSALTARYRTALPISGGTDSRLLLAASSEILGQISQYFVYHINWATSIDCILARQIAEKLCLAFRVISRDSLRYDEVLTDQEFDEIMAKRALRNGFEPDTADPRSIRAMHLAPQVDLVLRGNVAEMTRALRWLRGVFDDPHNIEFGLAKLGLTKEAVGSEYGSWESQYLDWKSRLPEAALPRIYDFLHTELWMPHTNSLGYMADTRDFKINPFNDRRLIELTLRVPPHARKRGRIVNHIVRTRMPEINDIPFAAQYMRDLRLQKAAAA